MRFPEKFPSTLVSFPYVGFPSIAEGLIEAAPPPDVEPADEDEDDGEGEEGGGQDIAADRPEPGVEAETERRRSEEHTSELQTLMRIPYAVFCLKNNTQHILSN